MSQRPDARPERVLATLALIGVALISLANVIVRYATDASFAFTEEFSVFLLVVITFAGAAVAARRNTHIRIGLFERRLGASGRRVLYTMQWLASMTVMLLVVYYGATFAHEEYAWDSLSPGLGLPNWWYVIWLPLLALTIVVRLTQQYVARLRGQLAEEHDDDV